MDKEKVCTGQGSVQVQTYKTPPLSFPNTENAEFPQSSIVTTCVKYDLPGSSLHRHLC